MRDLRYSRNDITHPAAVKLINLTETTKKRHLQQILQSAVNVGDKHKKADRLCFFTHEENTWVKVGCQYLYLESLKSKITILLPSDFFRTTLFFS